ncbi:N-acetylglucosamine-6-phosphate deacetylase [Niabella aurantiaca]|uniref:N-acetylglucosamine-6-phosphate deacetylase n=1 Tax=Niabella aurantiaca TaxID=379900 RepID=UPI0003766734|nr:N-acetylglucosamine-6-phosphate deacetylase [Niabella aurantiaca]
MQKHLKIINGKIITPRGILKGHTLYCIDGKIAAITTSHEEMDPCIEIDAGGAYVSPGFIDIHVHGGGGYDFMDNQVGEYMQIAATHARQGTTAMNPTTLSCGAEDLAATIRAYEQVAGADYNGARFIGLHIEGPYFAMNQRGAQDPRYIRNPDEQEYKALIASTHVIRRWSAAPELPGAIAFGKYLRSKQILPAIAHTDAIYEEVAAAYHQAGYTLATHLYSAMSGVTRRNAFRYAGVVESAYLLEDMFVELIADGRHLPAPLLKLAYRIKGADRIALITDAMRAAGTRVTESMLGSRKDGLKVIVEDGVAKLPDHSAFAGSIATCDLLVRNMMQLAEVPLEEAVRMMTQTPAVIMNVSASKGSLEKGKDADIVIFDEDILVRKTIVGGTVIFSAGQSA